MIWDREVVNLAEIAERMMAIIKAASGVRRITPRDLFEEAFVHVSGLEPDDLVMAARHLIVCEEGQPELQSWQAAGVTHHAVDVGSPLGQAMAEAREAGIPAEPIDLLVTPVEAAP
jgi:hypothetical protein